MNEGIKKIINDLKAELKQKQDELKDLLKNKDASEYRVDRCRWQVGAIESTLNAISNK